MPQSVPMIVKKQQMESLPETVQIKEDSSSVASGINYWYNNCQEAAKGEFAKNCSNQGVFFKCCIRYKLLV